MKDKSKKNIFRADIILVFLALTILTMAVTDRTSAKSLYVIADINANPQPLQAYDIGVDGTLTFQAEYYIPRQMLGGVGLAIDSDSGQLFVTYEMAGEIGLVDAKTMTVTGSVTAPGASNLAGIVYDHDKRLLYCADRRSDKLYIYSWDADTGTLSHVSDSPRTLWNATAYGIALDEVNDILYVANNTNKIYAYNTSNWAVRTITVSRKAVSVAVDVKNGFLYSGGGYAGNKYLTQYNLNTNTEKDVQVESDAGVMGLGVDTDTGLVYVSTGNDAISGGDNLIVYDKTLKQIDKIYAIGNPTGLVVPGKEIGYNQMNLVKEVTEGIFESNEFGEIQSVGAGGLITYTISFDNLNHDVLNEIIVVDTLPEQVRFISADDDRTYGTYDPIGHTYTWLYPSLIKGEATSVDLKVRVNDDVEPGTSFTNYVTIYSNETPSTTTGVRVSTTSGPLHIKKSVVGAFADEIKIVEPGENVTYRIHFDNYNDFRAAGIIIVDYLPEELTFVSADYDQLLGRYDADTHTYLWRYPALQPGDATAIFITGKVNQNVIPGTTITNSVVIDSNETSESISSVDVVVAGTSPVNRFNLTKSVIGAVDGVKKVGLNGEVTYRISFDGNDIVKPVANILVNDFLPEEVSFVKADGDGIIGHYNEDEHVYEWSYPYISPGEPVSLDISVKVNQNVDLGKTVTNIATISSDEIPPATASADIIISEDGGPTGDIPIDPNNIHVIPDTIRRGGTITDIMIVLELPEGISPDDVKDEPLMLYPGSIQAGEQIVKGRNGRTEVIAVFDVIQLMDAIPGYGPKSLKIKGQLNSGLSFYGQTQITITRFAN
jgi:uncharacterized repeat protein (TIGR01451 family)